MKLPTYMYKEDDEIESFIKINANHVFCVFYEKHRTQHFFRSVSTLELTWATQKSRKYMSLTKVYKTTELFSLPLYEIFS